MENINFKKPINCLAVLRPSRLAVITTIFLAVLCSFPLLAKAEVRISATVNKETVAINKNLQLTIAIQSTSNIDAPTIPKMKDFDIYSSGQNRKMSWVNGKTSYYVQFSYTLTPKKIGKAQIPSIIIFEGNKKRFTSPINIQVIKPNAPTDPVLPSPNSNVGMIDSDTGQEPYQKAAPKIDDLVFLTAKTNKKTAYINEQINVNLKFYTAIPLINNPHYTPPKLEGFISEDLPPVRNGRVNLKGRIYYYNEIKSALFAIDAGAAIINPATIDALIQTSNPNDLSSSGFFQSFFSGRRGEKKRVKSKKIKIKILPLPEKGKPASFNGAVGEYKISAKLENSSVKAGEAVNLILTISGKGNLKTITMPKLPEMSNFKIYDTLSSLSVNKAGDIVNGKKVFTTIMMPKISGNYKIKPIKFSFFNPKTKRYTELKTKALRIKVAKTSSLASVTDYSQGSTEKYSQIKTIASDIHYIFENKPIPLSLKLSKKIASALWLNFTFLLILVGALLFAYINGLRLKNPDLLKSKRAYKKTLKEIAKAKQSALEGDYSNSISLLHISLKAYLSAKLRDKIGGRTIKKTIAEINGKHPAIGKENIEDLKNLSDELEMLCFAPSSLDGEKIEILAQKHEKILRIFERELK